MSDKTDSSEVVVVPESIISSLEQVQRRATQSVVLTKNRSETSPLSGINRREGSRSYIRNQTVAKNLKKIQA